MGLSEQTSQPAVQAGLRAEFQLRKSSFAVGFE